MTDRTFSDLTPGQERTSGGVPRVALFTRPGCHLCDAARAVVRRVTTECGERYVECDVSLDPEALRAYAESIPVVVVDGVQIDFWVVSEDRLRVALGH